MSNLNTFLFLLAILCHEFNSCAANNVRLAKRKEFRFVASISLYNYGYLPYPPVHVCSGVLITRQHVITSAHCKELVNDMQDVTVRLGTNDWIWADSFKVRYWITYKQWAMSRNIGVDLLEHDISIIKLAKKVNCRWQLPTISKRSHLDLVVNQAKAIFWGPANGDQTSRFLKVSTVDVVTNNECIKYLNQTPNAGGGLTLDPSYLCTKVNIGAVLEYVDSGGPLFINEREVIAINDPTYLQRKNLWFPSAMDFHLTLHQYTNFINSITKVED